jgi:hypothetical protein
MSGAVRLALDAGLPVVVPAMGCLDSLGHDKAYVFADEADFLIQVDRMLEEDIQCV